MTNITVLKGQVAKIHASEQGDFIKEPKLEWHFLCSLLTGRCCFHLLMQIVAFSHTYLPNHTSCSFESQISFCLVALLYWYFGILFEKFVKLPLGFSSQTVELPTI